MLRQPQTQDIMNACATHARAIAVNEQTIELQAVVKHRAGLVVRTLMGIDRIDLTEPPVAIGDRTWIGTLSTVDPAVNDHLNLLRERLATLRTWKGAESRMHALMDVAGAQLTKRFAT